MVSRIWTASVVCALGLSAGSSARPEPPAPSSSAAVAPPAREVVLERLQWAKEVDGAEPITTVEVQNDFGDIRARLAGDRRLEAWMVAQRLDPGPDHAGFTVERRGPVATLVVGYPPGRIRDADPAPPKDSYDRVDLALFVPAGVTLRARTLRGQVEVRGLKSDVEATTLDGAIFILTSGAVQARTSGGEVKASFAPEALAASGSPMLFQSVSGPITLVLPARAEVDLRVETGGEVVATDRLIRRRFDGRTRATATLGRGQRLVLVSSATGRVTIEHAER